MSVIGVREERLQEVRERKEEAERKEKGMKIKGIEKYMRVDHYDFASMKPVVNINDLAYKFAAEVIDMQDEKIVGAIRDAARQAGISELVLIDKDFIIRAIQHELEREEKE